MTNDSHIKPSYIFDLSEKDINAAMYDFGTKYDRISEGVSSSALISDHFCAEEKPIRNSVLYFLIDAGLIDDGDHYITESGKSYFEALYIVKDSEAAMKIIKENLLHNPIINLVGQVFYGRGKISPDQLQLLLNYHRVSEYEIISKDVVSLLILLNRYEIVVYDKRNRLFYLKEPMCIEEPIKQYYISPSTPFSNVYNIRKVFRTCLGDIYWIDKHFRKEGFEMLIDGLAYEGVRSITIISGKDNVTASAQSDYKMLKQELSERTINLSWRIIDDPSFKWHDRWIVSDNCCYNIPPVLAIIRGQRSDILKTESVLDISHFVQVSIDIESIN